MSRSLTAQTILLIRPGALGDAVLTLPLLVALRKLQAQKVVVVGQPASWRMLPPSLSWLSVEDAGSTEWAGLYSSEVKMGERARGLVREADRAMVFLRSGLDECRGRLEKAGLQNVFGVPPPRMDERAPSFSSKDARLGRQQIFDADLLPCHAARQLMAAVRHVCVDEVDYSELERSSLRLDNFFELGGECDSEDAETDPSGVGDQAGIVVLHPGSGGKKKCWMVERFLGLARRIVRESDLVPTILWGPADDGVRQEFHAGLVGEERYPSVEHKPLAEVARLLGRAKAFVGNDSGVTHLAARRCPTVALFGPTDPAVWRPLGPRVKVIAAENGLLEEIEEHRVWASLWPLIQSGSKPGSPREIL